MLRPGAKSEESEQWAVAVDSLEESHSDQSQFTDEWLVAWG